MANLSLLLANWLLFSNCLCFASRIVRNGYTDVTVDLSSRTTAEDAEELVSNIQELVKLSSEVLHVATKRRSYFSSVTFVLPDEPSWLSQQNMTVFERNTGRKGEEIVITNDLFRKEPYTSHAEGCGKRGRRIFIPEKFVWPKTSLKEKSIEFIHHWAQYRYGVFPEGGFPYDDRYPLYYVTPGTSDVRVTSCTNTELEFTYTNENGNPCMPTVNNNTGKPEDTECIVIANTTSETLRSSIMYQQALPDVSEFCDSDFSLDKRHDPTSPSKHNLLCFEESPWIVALRSPDFARGKNQASKYKPENVTFKFERIGHLRIVVAVDVSSSMSHQGKFHLLKSALSKFILLDLPLGSEIGLVFYDHQIVTSTEQMVQVVDESSKVNLLESAVFPDEPGISNSSCPGCAIKQSIQILKDPQQSGIVVLFTASFAEEDARLSFSLRSKRIQLYTVVMSEPVNSQWLSDLSLQSGGYLTYIAEDTEKAMLMHLFTFFSQVVANDILFAGHVYSDEQNVTMQFQADVSPENTIAFLIFGPTYNIHDSPLDEDETSLISPTGNFISLRKQQHISSWFYLIESPEIGVYNLKSQWKESPSESLYAMAFVTASNVSSRVTARGWTDADQAVVGSTPVKVFLELTYGIHPIVNANVTAEVFGPQGQFVASFQLLDNGLGDPDITKNDGIYTRYFTNYSSPGHYSILITANDNKNRSKVIYVSSGQCCGSFMPVLRRHTSGVFNRIYGPISFYVGDRNNKTDIFPPNRISDLRVMKIDFENRLFVLQWSAAGDDLDQGAASSYKLKLFSERTEAKRRFEETGLLLEYNKHIVQHTPATQHGEIQEYTVQLPDTLETNYYFFAVKGMDSTSNSGPVSNLVEVYFHSSRKSWNITCEGEPDMSPKFKCEFMIFGGIVFSTLLLRHVFQF